MMQTDTFDEALKTAAHISRRDNSTIYINVLVRKRPEGMPYIYGYQVSDWFVEGSTIIQFTNGERKDL
jgi:hypothetical protein